MRRIPQGLGVLLGILLFSSTAHATGTVYLTFDMDMNGSMYQKAIATGKQWYDPSLFSYLEQNHIPATFFVSGLFVVAYPDLIKNLASTSEFVFENHSYDESSFVPNCYWLSTLKTADQKINQIAATEILIQQATGQTATYFRFPGICHDAANVALVQGLGYSVSDGSVISGDPFNKDTAGIVSAVVGETVASSTILMHVGGSNAPKSLAALEEIVPQLKAEGYEFAKL